MSGYFRPGIPRSAVAKKVVVNRHAVAVLENTLRQPTDENGMIALAAFTGLALCNSALLLQETPLIRDT